MPCRFSKADIRAATLASVTAYRGAMAGFTQMGTMDIWYAHLSAEELMTTVRSTAAGAVKTSKNKEKKAAKRAEKTAAAAGFTGRTFSPR